MASFKILTANAKQQASNMFKGYTFTVVISP